MELLRRVFSRTQPKNITKSIRMTQEMTDALQQLADAHGIKLNSYIVLRLDQMLQGEVKKGNIKLPPAS